MRMLRLRDHTLVFEVPWDTFRASWRQADAPRRLVLDDGRPAVRAATGDFLETLPWGVWEACRRWFDQYGEPEPARKRERLCTTCTTPLTLVREHSQTWAFACPRCHAVEVWGKTGPRGIGGTPGVGDREPT